MALIMAARMEQAKRDDQEAAMEGKNEVQPNGSATNTDSTSAGAAPGTAPSVQPAEQFGGVGKVEDLAAEHEAPPPTSAHHSQGTPSTTTGATETPSYEHATSATPGASAASAEPATAMAPATAMEPATAMADSRPAPSRMRTLGTPVTVTADQLAHPNRPPHVHHEWSMYEALADRDEVDLADDEKLQLEELHKKFDHAKRK